ncbi:MAG TPA: hypothetical protein VJ875_06275 [Pyrinomonadaceae bacterium]|nr:hypothetical protein [Pyrinomonadaceae bacterium]
MAFLINFTQTAFIYLQQAQESTEVKYIVALIAALASIIVAVISAAVSVFSWLISRKNQSALQKEQAALTKRNQEELANLQARLTLQTQNEIEKAKSELAEKSQLRLESHKADLTAKNQEEIEFLRATLGEQGKERDARRDYEYEAHKRLYVECEPLLFQLADLAEHGYHRVHSLARTARRGNLPDWLSGNSYYLRSTIYKLLAPSVIFRLIQQRLTFVDVTLDAYIANQYRLLKLLYLTFTDSFDFASIEPKIEYDPDAKDSGSKRKSKPQTYWRQGLYLGALDNAMDALLVTSNDKARLKTYGEFELEYMDPTSDTYQRLIRVTDILYAFHPHDRPVLWRMLCTQTLIYKKIIQSQSAAGESTSRVGLASVSPQIPEGGLDWRKNAAEASDDEALLTPQKVAKEYLHTRLPEVFEA